MAAINQRDKASAYDLAGIWVRVKPAVSILGSDAGFAITSSLMQVGMRVVSADPGSESYPDLRGRHDGLSPRRDGGLIAAVMDTSVTIMTAPTVAAARALGLILALKDGYHVALLTGWSQADIEPIALAIEHSSGKSLGPDFGLCLDPQGRLTRGDFSQVPQVTLQASDRRAFETVRPVYEAMAADVRFDAFP